MADAKKGMDAKKGKKADDKDEDDLKPGEGAEGADKPEGDEEEDEPADKSDKKSLDLSTDDLERSLSKLEAEVAAQPASRKSVLLAKAQKGEALSKAEVDELHTVLGGSAEPAPARLGEDLTRGMLENDTLQKSVEVSGVLAELQNELVKALDGLGEHVAKADARQHEFNLLLAKGLVETGRKVLDLSKSLEAMGAQPARAPKSKGIPGAQPLEKGFAGQPGAGEQLTKGQVLTALGEMVEKSMTAGQGGVTESGEDLAIACSRFEQFGQLSQGVANMVRAHVQSKK
jgi:hypothetical protein